MVTRISRLVPSLPVAAAATAVLVASACGGTTAARATTAAKVSPQVSSSAPAAGARSRLVKPTKVLVVVEENHSRKQMQAQMPYLAGLSAKYGYATNWKALMHPSEPNYLALAGGSNFGVTDDRYPSSNASKVGSAKSVFGQALAAKKTAATFAESMSGNCALTNTGHYAVRHNPWVYFPRERAACRKYDVSTSTFASRARANKLPNVGFLIPNVANDAHDGSLATADNWLKKKLRPVLASSDFTSGRLVVVVTADEDDRSFGNVVLTSVLTPHVHHKVVRTGLTHYSLTRYIDQVLGVKPLRNARTAPNMKTAFGL